MAPPIVQSQKAQPVTRAASQRVQRYLNRGTGRMEALVHGHFPGRPNGRPPGRSPSHPAGRAPAHGGGPAQPSLIQMTPAQIEDRAKRIVNSEIASERLPFQQRTAQLGGEETAQLKAHGENAAQLDTGTAGLQTQAAEGAKTYQNVAAEAVKRAEGAAPGVTQDIEHLGTAGTPALQQQQAAAKTLLTAIASASQAGTNARQQSEANFLTNLKGTEAQDMAARGGQIQGEYARRKQENTNKEGQVIASKAGRVGKLALGLTGEQEKLRIANAGLGIKATEAERHGAETRSDIAARREATNLARHKSANEDRKITNDENYKRANGAQKRLKDSLDIKKKELDIKKALEKHPGGGLTKDKVNELSGEAAKVFNIFKRARENGATPAQIREAITRGYFRRVPNKQEEAEKKKPYNEKTGLDLKQPIWLDVAEQIMQKEYVGAKTKQQLREMGLPDSEWSNHFLGGPKPPAPNLGKRKNYASTR